LARAGNRPRKKTSARRRDTTRHVPSYIESLGAAIQLAALPDQNAPLLELGDLASSRLPTGQLALSQARRVSTPSTNFLSRGASMRDRSAHSLGLRTDDAPPATPTTPSYALRIRSLHQRLSSQPRGLVYHSPRYTDYYAFGIRRTDRPVSGHGRRATPYGGPWYLPGAPTNFR
jgi:hypothetical protein